MCEPGIIYPFTVQSSCIESYGIWLQIQKARAMMHRAAQV